MAVAVASSNVVASARVTYHTRNTGVLAFSPSLACERGGAQLAARPRALSGAATSRRRAALAPAPWRARAASASRARSQRAQAAQPAGPTATARLRAHARPCAARNGPAAGSSHEDSERVRGDVHREGGQVPAPRPREPARGVKVHTAAAPNRYRWRCRREAHFLLGRSQGSRTSAAGRALVATTRRSVPQLRLRAGGA